MSEKIESLVLDLKSDPRFKLLKNEVPWGFWSTGGANYEAYTELESKNLRLLYVKEMFFGSQIRDEITVTNKKENVYAFCDSPNKDNLFNDKPIINTNFNAEELKDYIEKNA